MEDFLSLRRLAIGYPGRVVLQNIDLQIARGEIISVIGPNGAGKSTLLKSLSGQLPLLGGLVVMQGEDLQQCRAVERARKMAVVLTEHIRPEYMTCQEVVSAGRYPYTGRMGILQPQDRKIVEEAMDRMKVTELAGRDFNAISDGQKQRVLVARAIAQDTPVLLLDEPTSYLDIRYRTELMETLRELAREGRTVVTSLHEIELALDISDRILCVQEGQNVYCGSPREVLEEDRLRNLFGMSEEMYEKLFGEKKRRICGAAQGGAAQGSAAQGSAAQGGAAQGSAAQGSAAQGSAAQGSQAQSNTAQGGHGNPAQEQKGVGPVQFGQQGPAQDYSFFTNRSCKYFPCHKGADPQNFNCLFCYCPLYTLGPDCGGNFSYTAKGVKDCTGCLVPHRRENYGGIMEKLRGRNRACAPGGAAVTTGPTERPFAAVTTGPAERPFESVTTGPAERPFESATTGPAERPFESATTGPVERPSVATKSAAAELPPEPSSPAQAISRIAAPSEEMYRLVRKDLSALAMPPGSLGKIETTAARMAAIQGRRRPRAEKRRIIVLCADNGVVEENVASAPQEVTARQAVNMTKGLTGMSSIAAYRGDEVQVVDVGIATPYTCDKILNRKIRSGTNNIAKGPAMARDEAEKAVMTGIGLARQASLERVDIVGVGEMGIGNTTTSAAVISVLTGQEPEKVTGFGGGITEEAYLHKVACVQRAIAVNRPNPEDPPDVLAGVGGLDLAAMCGVFLGCALYGIPAVIDGVISAAAALCAVRLCPACAGYLFPSHKSVEPGYTAAMKALGIDPWFELDMRLGEGSGCTMSFAVMEAACAILERMATFEGAGIDDSYLEEIRKIVGEEQNAEKRSG